MQIEIFTIKNKSEQETDFITDILDAEKISYKLKPIKQFQGYFIPPITTGYDIELHTDKQHFLYFNKILEKEQSKLPKEQKPKEIQPPMFVVMIPLQKIKPEPKKSILKRIVDWISERV